MKPFIEIDAHRIGRAYPPLVIAEIGINHEGSLEKAVQMVDDAKAAGCECVKFQCHVIEDEMVPEAKKVIPGNADESIWDIMDRCKLSEADDRRLKDYVESKSMLYLSTPFSRAAAQRLERMNVSAFKIGSGECNNYPLIEHVARYGKPVILSTGMNDFDSISIAVSILRRYDIPFALLHCTSIYPTPYRLVRLRAISELQKRYPDAVVGLSDHSIGNYTCFAAAGLGASLLEKHFTSNKNWSGPDISLAIDSAELKDLVEGSKAVHAALKGGKEILAEEKPTIDFAYSSIVSIKNIKKGETFGVDNIWAKRPGTGDYLAGEYQNLLGKKAATNILKDIQIKRNMVK